MTQQNSECARGCCLSHLTTGYRGKAVTRDITATLAPGSLTCLLGPNGAGKSTLLKTICGFLPPLSGEVTVGGRPLHNFSARELARKVAVVLTDRPATLSMTVTDLVGMGRSPYTSFFGSLRPADRETVARAISLVGIDDLAERSVATLSDGERQKAFIAKALAQETDIIVLDEPTAFLDFPSKVDTMRLLYTIAAGEGKTVFMSTHDVELALQMADHLWLLDREHGLLTGTSRQLATDGSVNAYFDRDGLRFCPETGTFSIRR